MMRERNIRLTLAFDGTSYRGWQLQPGKSTIQGIVRDAIARITGEKANLIGSGRTDAGTHARALVANFLTRSRIPPAAIVRALNSALPADIRVMSARCVPRSFHARRSAESKVYQYRIYRAQILPPHLLRDHYHYPYPLNVRQMQQAAPLFIGEHDFASFAAKSKAGASSPGNTIRRIYRCDLKCRGCHMNLTVEGNGFLHHMVRNMVGTLLDIGRGQMSLEQFKHLFKVRDRTLAGFTAPAKGLVLLRVRY